MEFMCAYGNCTSTDTPIIVTDKTAELRDRFCSYAHLIEWAYERRRSGRLNAEPKSNVQKRIV